MARNFALAFVAVTLRIYLPVTEAFGIPFSEGYPVTVWFSWVPNLIHVEWWMLKYLESQASYR